MANITVGPGGGVIADGVVTYIPSCSAIQYADVSWSAAEAYDITSADYLEKVVPSVVPGIILGILCLLGFIFFSLWMCVQCCNRRRMKLVHDRPERAQFISGSQQQSAPYAPGKPDGLAPQRHRWARPGVVFTASLLCMAAAVAGVSVWGLVASIDATDSTFTDFWGIVADVGARVDNATRGFKELDAEIAPLAGNLTLVADKAQGLLDAITSGGAVGSAAVADAANRTQALVDALRALPDSVADISASVQGAVALLRDNFKDTIVDIKDSYEAPTMAIEETWRFIPIAVCFGLTILVSLLCGAAFWRLRWYRTATVLLWLLWLDIALLMLLGVGLLKGLYVVSSDSCKYVEFLSLSLVARKTSDSQRAQVLNALRYYFGVVAIEDKFVVSNITGVPTYLLHDFVQGPTLNLTDAVFDQLSSIGQQSATAAPGVDKTQFVQNVTDGLVAIKAVTDGLPAVSETLLWLESQAKARSVVPLYHRVKEYICCELSQNAHDLWVAWTVAGVLGFVLALMCSGALVHDMLTMRRERRRMTAAAAAMAGSAGEEGPCCEGDEPPPPDATGRGSIELSSSGPDHSKAAAQQPPQQASRGWRPRLPQMFQK